MMSLWVVRAGRFGEQEEGALRHGVAAIGWDELSDLSSIKSKESLRELYERLYPGAKKMKAAADVGQLWTFIDRIQTGDLIVLPLKLRAAIAIGRATGPYQYRTDLTPNIHHVRPVEWLSTELPRTKFDQDLLYSFGGFKTVFQVQRNNAEQRVRAIVEGRKPPSSHVTTEDSVLDVEQAARDQITAYINQKFAGHALARLVEAVLQAQGYLTRRSEPGPDGGVDILAGAGPMGFERPRLCAQVKTSQSDVTVLRNLQGAMTTFGADQGLLVSWGGFTRPLLDEARRSFFAVRLWDSGHLLEALLRYWDELPDEVRAELPLKRIWALVLEEEYEPPQATPLVAQ